MREQHNDGEPGHPRSSFSVPQKNPCTQGLAPRRALQRLSLSTSVRGEQQDVRCKHRRSEPSGRAKSSNCAVTELRLPPDYEDLIREFVEGNVAFVVVGGWAVAVHGHPRATDDLDLFIEASHENADRVFTALRRFGAPLEAHGVTSGLFTQERYGYRVGRKPFLIEILTGIDGVAFKEAESSAVVVRLADLLVPVIGRAELLRNKAAAGRAKDLADIEALTAHTDSEQSG